MATPLHSSCFTVSPIAFMSFVDHFFSLSPTMSKSSAQPIVSEIVNFSSEGFMLPWNILFECIVPFEKYDHLVNCQIFKRFVKIRERNIDHLKFTLIFDSLSQFSSSCQFISHSLWSARNVRCARHCFKSWHWRWKMWRIILPFSSSFRFCHACLCKFVQWLLETERFEFFFLS